jgi:feruloyl esterase
MRNHLIAAVLLALSGTAVAVPANAAEPGTPCARLTTLRIPDVRIVKASEVRPDPVWMAPLATPPSGYSAPVRKAFCRVEGIIEDEIGFELWLPAEWNGRLLGTGNGGFAGFIRYEGLARGVNRGFASASTDTGHKISEAQWPIGHPRRLENYGHRAQHLLAVNAKAIIAAHYGRPAAKHYFMGCSGGGMQGMNEVQKYPADYDGIIAGAHGRSIVGISARWLTSALVARNSPAASLSVTEWKGVAAQATKLCDAQDGLVDGIISRPRECKADPGATPGLSPAQAATARLLYGPVLGSGGAILYPGFTPGVAYEPITEPGRPAEVFAQWLYGDPAWDPDRFDAARDVPAAEAAVPGAAPTNPNLEAFFGRGGKMISFHGWNDPIVPVQATIDYWDSVGRYMTPATRDRFYKLYLAVGMDHCRGGVGPDSFGFFGEDLPEPPTVQNDLLTAMVEWVEQGREPGTLTASKLADGKIVMTRPVCAWPLQLRYTGQGDPNAAMAFTCAR